MAGYLFTFSDEDMLKESLERGLYSTYVSRTWSVAVQSTLGDYVTMRDGDDAYFFCNRKIYGIGRIVDVFPGVTVAENFEGATSVVKVNLDFAREHGLTEKPVIKVTARNGNATYKVQRWVIMFEPAPYLFAEGVDMDDMLQSDPSAFREVRAFSNRSFIKIDDEESMAFKRAILRRNMGTLRSMEMKETIECDVEGTKGELTRKLGGRNAGLSIRDLMRERRERDGSCGTESVLEAGALWQLSKGDSDTVRVLGRWDYLSHQVHASPTKPVQYMDKMDIFAYRWTEGFAPIVGKYCVFELKRGTVAAEDLRQVLKYVDWCRSEYAGGDYSLISACLIGHDFDLRAIESEARSVWRNYTRGTRPAEPATWADLHLVSYEVEENGHIGFSEVMNFEEIPLP